MAGKLWFNASVVEWSEAANRAGTLLPNTATFEFTIYAATVADDVVGAEVVAATAMSYEADGQFAGRIPNDSLTVGSWYWIKVTATPSGGETDERWEKRQCTRRSMSA